MSDKARYPVLAGWIAGSLEIVATYPIEYVKTQLQLQATPHQFLDRLQPRQQPTKATTPHTPKLPAVPVVRRHRHSQQTESEEGAGQI